MKSGPKPKEKVPAARNPTSNKSEGLEEVFEFITTLPASHGRRHSSQMEEDI